MRRRLLRLCAVLILVAGAAACSDSDHTEPRREPTVMPKPFAAEVTAVPAGFREVLCPDLRGDGTGLTVRLVVPIATTGMQQSDGSCSFGRGFVRGVGVQIAPRQTLAEQRAEELEPFEDTGGDDSVSDITYRTGVPGLDGQRAEELGVEVYNDGLPFWSVSIQAAGVELSWSVPADKPRRLADFDTVRRSVAVVQGTRTLCPSWGRPGRSELTFSPPKDIGSVEREGDRCVLYVDGAPTVLEHGIVDPSPSSLERLAARLRRDPEVSQVRRERDAGMIDGESADRLTWVVTRTKETESYEPAGTWRLEVLQSAHARVQWGGTPAWWRSHRSTYDELVASVRRD